MAVDFRWVLYHSAAAGRAGSTTSYARRLGYGPDRIVPHGFLAMARTQLNERGFSPDITELQLAHRDSSVRAIYNCATRLPERRVMMQAWADWLDTLIAARREADCEGRH